VDGVVASKVDPRHFTLDLLGEPALGPTIAEKIKRYEWGSSFFVIYAALDRPVAYRAGAAADSAGYVHAAGQTLDELAETFVQCRAGLLPSAPMVGIINEAGMDPTRAPEGRGLMKFVLHYVPYRVTGDARGKIAGTDWDQIKDAYADTMIDFLSEPFLPGLRDRHGAFRAVAGRSRAPHQKRGARHASTRRLSALSDRGDAADPRARLLPLAHRQLSICAGPAAIPAQASPWRRGGTRPPSFAPISVSPSRVSGPALAVLPVLSPRP
jgi:hypothetical protein